LRSSSYYEDTRRGGAQLPGRDLRILPILGLRGGGKLFLYISLGRVAEKDTPTSPRSSFEKSLPMNSGHIAPLRAERKQEKEAQVLLVYWPVGQEVCVFTATRRGGGKNPLLFSRREPEKEVLARERRRRAPLRSQARKLKWVP